MNETPDWWIFKGTNNPHNDIEKLPPPPSWRKKDNKNTYIFDPEDSIKEIELVNAALYLRRPLLVTGKPGTGKSSLAEAVAFELGLGEVLRWSITSQSTLKDGLYRYDAIARLHDTSMRSHNPKSTDSPDIGKYLSLGALGSALARTEGQKKPRVLLIDEIDKGDLDFPNNLLHVLEENKFEIPELERLHEDKPEIFLSNKIDKTVAEKGIVECEHFPLIIMTSNGEREFPPAFLRRCLQLEVTLPEKRKLEKIVASHLGDLSSEEQDKVTELISSFIKKRSEKRELATDQLLNAVYMTLHKADPRQSKNDLLDTLWRSLSSI